MAAVTRSTGTLYLRERGVSYFGLEPEKSFKGTI